MDVDDFARSRCAPRTRPACERPAGEASLDGVRGMEEEQDDGGQREDSRLFSGVDARFLPSTATAAAAASVRVVDASRGGGISGDSSTQRGEAVERAPFRTDGASGGPHRGDRAAAVADERHRGCRRGGGEARAAPEESSLTALRPQQQRHQQRGGRHARHEVPPRRQRRQQQQQTRPSGRVKPKLVMLPDDSKPELADLSLDAGEVIISGARSSNCRGDHAQ